MARHEREFPEADADVDDVELLITPDCPHRERARDALRRALDGLHVGAPVREVVVGSPEEARELGFVGSPTIRVNGQDIEDVGEEVPPRLECRTYKDEDGVREWPTPGVIREGVERILHGGRD